jgi:hypothetical protein
MKKINFGKIATKTLSSAGGGIIGVEADVLASRLPFPKPIIQAGKIAAAIAASFFMPKQEIVQDMAKGLIGQSSAELYKSLTKRGSISGMDDDEMVGNTSDGTVYVNENGVQTDSMGNPLVIEGIGFVDQDGNQVDEEGNLIGEIDENEYQSNEMAG